jgi:hypothetical protein
MPGGSSNLLKSSIFLTETDTIMEKFKVYSTLADTVVCVGTKSECQEFKRDNENSDNTLYILKA